MSSSVPVNVPILKCYGIARTYARESAPLEVLKGVELTLNAGEMVALVGQSGSGKSTLLQILGLLDKPDEGKLFILGSAAHDASDAVRTGLRNRYIGYVYQFHHLLPELTALENAMMPMRIAGKPRREAAERASVLLTRLGLGERLTHRPAQLSGGEQQRVAIARALSNHPKLLLADEPTGNLDAVTAAQVTDLLLDVAREEGVSALIATHNPDIADRLSRTLRMDGGVLVA